MDVGCCDCDCCCRCCCCLCHSNGVGGGRNGGAVPDEYDIGGCCCIGISLFVNPTLLRPKLAALPKLALPLLLLSLYLVSILVVGRRSPLSSRLPPSGGGPVSGG